MPSAAQKCAAASDLASAPQSASARELLLSRSSEVPAGEAQPVFLPESIPAASRGTSVRRCAPEKRSAALQKTSAALVAGSRWPRCGPIASPRRGAIQSVPEPGCYFQDYFSTRLCCAYGFCRRQILRPCASCWLVLLRS